MDRYGVGHDDDDDNDDDSDDELLDELAAMRVIRRRSLEFVLGVHCMRYLHAYFVLWQIYLPEFRLARFQ